MKKQRLFSSTLALGLLLALAVSIALAQGPGPREELAPQDTVGTAFTYQGRLTDGGSPANGHYDFKFQLYDAASDGNPVGSTVAQEDVAVSEGLFTVQLDFGTDAFTGEARWLEIGVRPGSGGTYTILSPRQPLTPAPYALGLRPGAVIAGDLGVNEAALTLDHAVGGGLRVKSAGGTAVYVDSAGGDGMYVESAGGHAVYVDSADNNGLEMDTIGNDGVVIGSAGDDGVVIGSVGSPSTASYSTDKNGLEVAGAEGYGLYVGRADVDGVYVDSAGYDGLFVSSAVDDGLHVGAVGDNGVYVYLADDDGVYVDVVGDDGVHVSSAGDDGVYANTTQANNEWGFYTPDKVYAGTTLASGGPLMLVAQNGGGRDLDAGEVVVVSGLGNPFGESDTPVPLVQAANADPAAPVFGVVYRRFVLEEERQEIEKDDRAEQVTSLHSRSVEGPAAPGDYLLVVVIGPAQVKAEALSGKPYPGALLAVNAQGKATAADASNLAFGRIIGTALEAPKVEGDGLVWVLVMPR
ncbi:MAG: hypothetical protein DRI80_05880 [Chloroflexota bacterium]|nr:MAG: hypothetical protein DRI80_05880 [Chloroflexota bacterium]